MAFKQLKFAVTAGPISTSSTAQITLGSFDTSALPGGYGAIVSPTGIFIRSKIMIDEINGDHDSCTWEKCVQFSLNSSSGGTLLSMVGSPVSGNLDTQGKVGGAVNNSTFTYDTTGSWTIRCRVTPDTSNSFVWYAYHDIQVVQYS